MQRLNLKPSHKLVKSYYETLGNYGQLNIDHEMAVRSAFQNLLAGCRSRRFLPRSRQGSPNPIASDLPKNERREGRLAVPIWRNFLQADIWPASISCREHDNSQSDPNGPPCWNY
jgi:hypothetical protein